MIVDVHVGPCPDPGSTPGVSTNYELRNGIILYRTTWNLVFKCVVFRSKIAEAFEAPET